MYSTTAYLYQQKARVLLVETDGSYFTARYEPVYAKSLTLNRGVDNVLLFEFINQDQKPVNITGSTFVFRIINQDGLVMLLEKPMQIIAPSRGRVKVVIDSSDTDRLIAQPASYSILRTQGNYTEAVYVDDAAGARGDINIVDSVGPKPLPSKHLTIPDIYGPPGDSQGQAEYFSSEVLNPLFTTTFQLYIDTYTGTIKFQGKQDDELEWTNASYSYEYQAESGWKVYEVTGYYDRLRVALDNRLGYSAQANVTAANGVITSASVTAPGYNYIAPPRIRIFGNGSGAAATSTLNGAGGVASITITQGGSGYTPLAIGGSTCGTVVIDGGGVLDILYR
jgi:hypothetical protein